MPACGITPSLAGITHTGCVRQRNEDNIFYAANLANGQLLAVVADGMGGHAGGAIASHIAVSEFEQAWQRDAQRVLDDRWLAETLRAANRQVCLQADGDPALESMGSTVVALLVAGNVAHIGHIGDSRCYRQTANHLSQLTTDHTVVQQMVDEGALTPAEAARSPIRNYLTRCLGLHGKECEMDLRSLPVNAGDRFLLCSDGLTNMLSHDEIEAVLDEPIDDDVACQKLLSAALSLGANDNVSVIICSP